MDTVNNSSTNSVVISIALPAGVEVEAGTVSGDGLVSGISGHTKLNTVSGSVMADGTSGELHVNTVSGEVIARNHEGVLTAKSVSGEVTASGRFSNIRANTVSGDMSFDLRGFTHDFGANSVSGDLTVRLPRTSESMSWPSPPAAPWSSTTRSTSIRAARSRRSPARTRS